MNPVPRDENTFTRIEDYPYENWRQKRKRGERIVELTVDYSVPDLIKHVTFEFEERLLEQEDDHQYSLFAFIVHHGYSASRGHYFCYVKLASGDWCKYNDDSVTIIPDIDAQPQK